MTSDSEPGGPKAAWGEPAKLNASQQASRRTAQLNAHGRAILALAALVGQQGGSTGPDVLRRLIGPQDTLTVLDSVGSGARELAEAWQADQPSRGPAQRTSSSWASSPDHDPRVDWALTHGASDAELARIRAEVHEEHRIKAMERQARDREYYGLDRPAALGVSQGPGGAPLQASVRHDSVPELGSEQ